MIHTSNPEGAVWIRAALSGHYRLERIVDTRPYLLPKRR